LSTPEKDHRTPCPECGELFHPRGLASHRHHRHGTRPTGGRGAILAELARITDALARIEERLEQLEPEGRPNSTEVERKEAELEELLAQIRAVVAERQSADGPHAEERRQACDAELGRLRRRQAELLYWLGPLAPGGRERGARRPLELL